MENFIYDGWETPQLISAINASGAKPLIEELHHQYGLKVYDMVKLVEDDSWTSRKLISFDYSTEDEPYKKGKPRIDGFLMTTNGLPQCMAFASYDINGVVSYQYYNPRYTKDRASSSDDAHILRSVKLSSLMSNIKKNSAMPSDDIFDPNWVRQVKDMIADVDGIKRRKYNRLDTDQLHELLKMALLRTYQPSKDMLELFTNNLNTFDSVDVEANNAIKDIDGKLGKDFHMLMTYTTDGYVVGKARVVKGKDNDILDITEPFVRVKSLDDYKYIDEVRGILTMYKLHAENQRNSGNREWDNRNMSIVKDYFPTSSIACKELDVYAKLQYHWNGISAFEHSCLIIPTES